jgi:hypothetical protein
MRVNKLAVGLIMTLAVLSAATPAAAMFETNGKSKTGAISLGNSEFVDELATVDCAKAEGEWRIAKAGGGLIVDVKRWNSCSAFGFVGAEVKPCEFELNQPIGGSSSRFAVITACTIVATGSCELKIPVSKANENLLAVSNENVGTDYVGEMDVIAVTSVAKVLGGIGCVGVKNLSNKQGTLFGTITAEGVKAV